MTRDSLQTGTYVSAHLVRNLGWTLMLLVIASCSRSHYRVRADKDGFAQVARLFRAAAAASSSAIRSARMALSQAFMRSGLFSVI